jgi:hypothetical protein
MILATSLIVNMPHFEEVKMTTRKRRPNPAAAALRALGTSEGAAKGGRARMATLTQAERRALAPKAIGLVETKRLVFFREQGQIGRILLPLRPAR